MSSIEKIEDVLQDWKDYIKDDSDSGSNDYKKELVHEIWSPRWKWVNQYLGWFEYSCMVRWAYKIKKTTYKNVYPIGIPHIEECFPEDIGISLKASSETQLAIGIGVEQLKQSMINRIIEKIDDDTEEGSDVKVSK